jgi:hypothetical protein
MSDDQLKQISEEYNLIQSKIDGIGEFKFKVRGWLITILSAILATLITDKIPHPFDYFIFIIPLIFHLLEREQTEIQGILSDRARRLEKAITLFKFPKSMSQNKLQVLQQIVLNDIESSPRIAVLLHNGARRNIFHLFRGMLNFNTNKLYHILYGSIFVILVVKYFQPIEKIDVNLGNSNIEIDRKNIDVTINNNNIHHYMNQSSINEVEEKMYSLVSQIDYGDISDLDVYWKALAVALLKLDIEGWEKPNTKVVSEVLDSIRGIKIRKSLKERTKTMEKLSEKGSSGSFSKNDLKSLQDEAVLFEKEFEELLEKFRGHEQRELFAE